MLGTKPGKFWLVTWCIVAPLFLGVKNSNMFNGILPEIDCLCFLFRVLSYQDWFSIAVRHMVNLLIHSIMKFVFEWKFWRIITCVLYSETVFSFSLVSYMESFARLAVRFIIDHIYSSRCHLSIINWRRKSTKGKWSIDLRKLFHLSYLFLFVLFVLLFSSIDEQQRFSMAITPWKERHKRPNPDIIITTNHLTSHSSMIGETVWQFWINETHKNSIDSNLIVLLLPWFVSVVCIRIFIIPFPTLIVSYYTLAYLNWTRLLTYIDVRKKKKKNLHWTSICLFVYQASI